MASLTADAYQNRLKQLIDQVPAGTGLLTYFVNDDRVHAQGLELEAGGGTEIGTGGACQLFGLEWQRTTRPGFRCGTCPAARRNSTGPRRWGAGDSRAWKAIYVSAMTDGQGTRVHPVSAS